MENPKLVFFAEKPQTTMLWSSSETCDVVDVAKKPYFEVAWINQFRYIIWLGNLTSVFNTIMCVEFMLLFSTS